MKVQSYKKTKPNIYDVTFDNRNRLINVKTFEGYRLSATYKTARTQVNKEGEDD